LPAKIKNQITDDTMGTEPEEVLARPGKGEYANPYNPFWQVRLTKNQI